VSSHEVRSLELRVAKPGLNGEKSNIEGYFKGGQTSLDMPLYFEFGTDREGYHQLSARITGDNQPPTRAVIQVEYEAPAQSDKF
jgi:hypothetical protein